jgi:hypothetical protein
MAVKIRGSGVINLLTYLLIRLTQSLSWEVDDQKISSLYGILWFIAVFTKSRHLIKF